MKKIFLALSVMIVSSTFALATHNGGFQDNLAGKFKISDVLKMQNNSFVTIQGNIIKRLSDDKYTFKDETGTITVEIDDDKWAGQNVNMNDKLELKGEVERKFNSTILDVDSVTKITK